MKLIDGADYVIHLSGYIGHPSDIATDFQIALNQINVITNELEASYKCGVKGFLDLNSSTGYPDRRYPITEDEYWDEEPYISYYGYGWMRRYREKIMEHASHLCDMKIGIARGTAIFGPHDNFNLETCHVVPALIKRVLSGEDPFVVWGSPDVVRDFLYVKDVVKGCLLVLEKGESMRPYNVGYGSTITIGDIVDVILKVTENQFTKKLDSVYKLIDISSKNDLLQKKDLFGFVGAPWTILVYMLNQVSPKKELKKDFFDDKILIEKLLTVIVKFLKLHIKNQIDSGATIIQIFDSWAGLVEEKKLDLLIYKPTLDLVNFIKSLNVPVICFPREIKDYKKFVNNVKPDVVNIDYSVDPKEIVKNIEIPVQGGLDPKVLLTDKDNIKKNAIKYMEIFKDHPYIFNLGHGVLPETNPDMVKYLVNTVKDFK